jgi:outer membrane porin, OprD family
MKNPPSPSSRIRETAAATAALLLLSASMAAIPAESGDDFTRALTRDSTVTLHLRTYYLDRTKPGPAESEAWAGGGWLGYETGWFAGLLRFGVVGYTSQPFYAPDDKDGTTLLKPGQEGYSVLGQAYGSLKLKEQVFTAYRQLVDQPEVNPQDNRMTPNTFQGYTLTGKVAGIGYFAGYLDKMKTRNSDEFVDMATVAGAPAGVTEGMWLGGLSYAPGKDIELRLSSYHVPNILTSTYGDASWVTALTAEHKLRLGGQVMYQTSTGDNLLNGTSFHAASGGLMADLMRGPATLSLAYTQTASDAAYQSPYGTWPGYTSMMLEDFDRAGERAWLIGGTYEFARHAPGLSVNVAAILGHGAIDPATRAPLSDNTEYDATLDYRFSKGEWPAWAKPLWIRLRYARVEKELGGNTDVTRDYRVIVNYEWVFK